MARACFAQVLWRLKPWVWSLVLLSVALKANGGSLALTDLDLTQVHGPNGPQTEGEQSRTETGVVLGAGSSLWVDLHHDAQQLKAQIGPLTGSRGAPVRCRFATAHHVFETIVTADSKPRDVSLPLKGHKLLTLDVYPTTADANGVRVHVTASSITSSNVRPEAWGGAAPVVWRTRQWEVRVDGRSGGLTQLRHPDDRMRMNWIRPAALWGTGWVTLSGKTLPWDRPSSFRRTEANTIETVYDLPGLKIFVSRKIDALGRLREDYTFENTSKETLVFREGGIGIHAPLFDSYPGAELCLTERCHAHLWMGGTTAYVNAMRMGGAAPHLGLVVHEGSLTQYSVHNRVDHSNDRGQFVLHPAPMTLPAGERRTLGWTLFWHEGWPDFFKQAMQVEGFVRFEADRYTLVRGEKATISAAAAFNLADADITVNDLPAPSRAQGGLLEAHLPLDQLGEHTVAFELGGLKTLLRLNVVPPPLELIAARVKFILQQQQRDAAGEALDGAFLIYDNEKNVQVHDRSFPDHNAGRERLAMGTLAALYLPHCDDPELKEELVRRLRRHEAFVARELQDLSGVVYNDIGRSGPQRMYNYPWVMQFHLAMYQAFGDATSLRRAVETARAYYARGGERFYCIGMPVRQMVETLRGAGWRNEAKEMTALFRKHADALMANGTAYPKHEVNYEQSIVGPAAQLLLEFFLVTKEQPYLAGAVQQLKLLELFNGRQPDFHLHEIAIRHWDGYWFGGRKMYGDTFPHYWSTITGQVYALYAEATGDLAYRRRAEENLMNNFCLFQPDGRASAAYLYPLAVNGKPGRYYDPWANDQDWALVYWLLLFGGPKP